jgi:GNAT superfamily N-acetyltransferase
MKARILTVDEWGKLDQTQLPALLPFVSPENIAIVVVEDEGEVVASMAVLRATHFEGAWIKPTHRNAGVTRALLRHATALARVRGEHWVFGGSADERMTHLMEKLGGQQVPMELYALWLGES